MNLTESDIREAFAAMDFDRNGYVGCAEIMHFYTKCLGENITDEEVDELVNAMDKDGDGQISYDEFLHLVSSDIFSEQEPRTIFVKIEPPELVLPVIPTSKGEGLEEDRGQSIFGSALLAPSAKQVNMTEFQNAYKFDIAGLKRAHKRQTDASKDGEADYEDFVAILGLQDTELLNTLFKLYDEEKEDAIDMREFFMGLCSMMTQAKITDLCKFVFTVYDPDKHGFLSSAKVLQILKASHFCPESQVFPKAKWIMGHTDAHGTDRVSYEEFVTLATKFPNLLFPSYNASSAVIPRVA
mmetsp:Transcript_1536/g.2338  ORF Transcript_1536/g.2338 Transcript_1536/m.2338 type:complete len:297 (+) Transcript_1536:17-907(+)|eukprot:CAMPEP_0184676156 /NCGR_PEP_ID=MMETSP0308-20130426/88200_1 /TAXON_ID=38269 /ORGANISM="Gloeochaete witrockiana, Strain SAG 46.84" /LENGTH=296 /DNA_ID=CAMNT_0027123967 /DNA_START=768 /DNA_END=1658 /DNA_ORIENTATION=-